MSDPCLMVILGRPRTKGNHGVIAAGKRPIMLPSKQYRAWFKIATQQVPALRVQSGIRKPITEPVNVTAVIFRERNHAADEDNYFKGLGDFLQRAGFVKNDRLIHWTSECRLDVDPSRPRIEVQIAYRGATTS